MKNSPIQFPIHIALVVGPDCDIEAQIIRSALDALPNNRVTTISKIHDLTKATHLPLGFSRISHLPPLPWRRQDLLSFLSIKHLE